MLRKQISVPPRFHNSLEPPGLIQHFLHCPPDGFETVVSAIGQPGFRVKFDLLTTVDERTLRFVNRFPASGLIRKLLTWNTLFWGTTVTEYLPLPSQIDGLTLVESMLTTWRRSTMLCVLKDIPSQSPLLTEAERIAAAELIEACKNTGFILIAGQALAYVPIDFENVEEYLSRLSSARRKNIRRKMRARADIQIEMMNTGYERLNNAAFLNELYEGGFKFQVQRVNDGAVAHSLPAAWQSSDIFVGAYSADENRKGIRTHFCHR
jgi:Peptidogalycan biosysnthesis/recognition